MKVLKFGGTSVGSAEMMNQVKNIVSSQNEQLIVVVSAMGGVTDKLYAVSKLAAAGDSKYEEVLAEIVEKHRDVIKSLDLTGTTTSTEVENILVEFSNVLKGVYFIKDISERITDLIVSFGERLTSVIMAGLTGATHVDSRKVFKTNTSFGKHTLNFDVTAKLIDDTFSAIKGNVVCGGFISTDALDGHVTNLGRGGSDYTASILAAQLNASILEIWTDVDGFMTADPKVIDNAYVIDQLTFVEAMELCNFGAKVIYPPTIFPVFNKSIPIKIKNTMRPEVQGTLIFDKENNLELSNKLGRFQSIKGISSINDTCLITIQGLGMVGVIGVNYRIFKALAQHGISVFMVSQASSENTTSIAVKNAEADKAVEVLNDEFNHEIVCGEIHRIKAERDLATVAIVGEGMKRTPGIAGKLFGTLGRNGINVIACAQGASETNISFVTDLKSLRKALNVIHDSFFLSEYQELNIFLTGIGTVGGSLLEQIKQQQEKLMVEKALKINVVGIADVKNALFCRGGINLDTYQEDMKTKGIPNTPELLKNEVLSMNIFNSVFVDCTASPKIAELYKELLSNNISVVAANKIAASGDYHNYVELKEIAQKRGIKYLFETNVGAGLPIMNTINNLINSGDTILKMEAVLSGTLNFIFNTISEEIPLSKAIVMAKEARFAEPDPRIDLSGTDVIRKLVILSREAGYIINQDDVAKNLFVPQRFFDGTLDDFWTNISELDEEFEEKRKELSAKGQKYRFVATNEEGRCSVGLQAVGSNHPFYDLEGSNNILMITTERYKEYPMIIKGYGAGADVTAAGVFADIISIANIR